MNKSKVLITALLLSMAPFNSNAWKVRFDGGANCPDMNPKVGWRDYITGTVPPVGKYAGNPYGIQFRFAKNVKNPEIGGLATNQCYSGGYIVRPAGNYAKRGFSSDAGSRNSQKQGLPGDPFAYQINVQGVILMYTDKGMILDKRGREVGALVCFGSNECGAY
jgi:hypothetical protein